MKTGDRIKFAFADGEKEGIVERLTPKKAYLRVDFPHHKDKLITRKISVLEAGAAGSDKKKKDKKEKKVKKEKKEKK